MILNADFRRDMQQNLFVLKDQEISASMFQEKMLEHNQLEGLLPIRVQRMNGERMIFYDLYGLQPLSEVCHVTLPNTEQLTTLVQGILQVIKRLGEYLLKEDDILLSLEYMFVRLPDYQVKLCYYPGYQMPIKKQISQLFEALMSCVDYEDRDAVYLIYSLYMKSKDESCTVFDLEQLLHRKDNLEGVFTKRSINMDAEIRSNVFQENPVQLPYDSQSENQLQKQLHKQMDSKDQQKDLALAKQLSNNQRKERYINQEIPLAMSTSVMPSEFGIEGGVNQNKNTVKREEKPKGNVQRPLISNHREEEKEVWFYPSTCYLFGGLIAISAVIVFGIILKSNILSDPVVKKVEPLKLVAALCIVILPAFYGMKVIFNPQRKLSKSVSVGEYQWKEIAATKEARICEIPKILPTIGPIPEFSRQYAKVATSELEEQGYDIKKREEASLEKEDQFQSENIKSVSDKRTVLLNGVQASPFAQLISEHPEKAETITLVKCPFYIGTVKNQMNYSLSCPVISRYHAKIEKIDGIYYISDLNSTNGTFVNGRRLKAEEANVLVAGDKVAFANICFIFACPSQIAKR